MKGIFCLTNAKTDEEYRDYLKKRITAFTILGIIGFVTIAAVMFMNHFLEDLLNGCESFIIGIGSGLLFASVILIIKLRRVINDSEKLRRARIQATDERNIQISTAAMKVTLAVMFAADYIIMFVGGFRYPILTKIATIIILTAILAYLIAYKVLSKRF